MDSKLIYYLYGDIEERISLICFSINNNQEIIHHPTNWNARNEEQQILKVGLLFK